MSFEVVTVLCRQLYPLETKTFCKAMAREPGKG